MVVQTPNNDTLRNKSFEYPLKKPISLIMSEPFKHLLRVRYAECDAQQVVFNSRYVEYADVALTEFMRAVYGDYKSLLAAGMDNQVINMNLSWKGPARFDDVLALSVHTARIGNTSFTIQVDITNYETGAEIVIAEISYVLVSVAEYKKMLIPDDLRKLLEKGAPGVISNHAGI